MSVQYGLCMSSLTSICSVFRFVFAIPPVQCAPLRLHVSHPTPGYIQQERRREHLIHTEVSPLAANYHKISTKMTVQFPELRLIQYDCGMFIMFISKFSADSVWNLKTVERIGAYL